MRTIGIHGAAGRMGQRLVALAVADPELRLTAALEHRGHDMLGRDAGTVAGTEPLAVPLSERWESAPQVMVDFSTAEALPNVISLCQSEGVALVIGTTGYGEAGEQAIEAAARKIPVLQATNMSLGVNLLFILAGQIAQTLGDDYDIEIVEAHHRFKRDAPSGTAMSLAESICQATGKQIKQDLVHGREGDQPRQTGEIGMHALRLGDVVGRHSVSYATLGEQVQISHEASTRDVFARGALRAAKWLAERPAGRYHMKDVLGL